MGLFCYLHDAFWKAAPVCLPCASPTSPESLSSILSFSKDLATPAKWGPGLYQACIKDVTEAEHWGAKVSFPSSVYKTIRAHSARE